MNLSPGLHKDVSHNLYHSDPCSSPSLSTSIAKVLLGQSPLHAWLAHPKLGAAKREGGTPAKNRGTIIHDLVLGGGGEYEIVLADNWQTKAARQERDEIEALGKIAVLAPKMEEYQRAANAMKQQLAPILDKSQKELTAVWCSKNGTLCRGRIDMLLQGPGVVIYDLKTCENASAAATPGNILKYGYDIQCTAYMDAVPAAMNDYLGRVSFQFIFAEIKPPYGIKFVELDGAFRELGGRKWDRACETWAHCLKNSLWPNYPLKLNRIEAPPWALSQDLDQQLSQLGDESDASESKADV